MTASPQVQIGLGFLEGFDITSPGLPARSLPVEHFTRPRRTPRVW
jgi:hypothetical protein